MSDKVDVKIYGQTYTITGDKTQKEIEKIAGYVDDRMHLISKVMGRNGTSAIAVLTSINIAEEFFDEKDEMDRLKTANEQLERDTAHYIKLWEDAKKNYKQLIACYYFSGDVILYHVDVKKRDVESHYWVNRMLQQKTFIVIKEATMLKYIPLKITESMGLRNIPIFSIFRFLDE